MVKRMLALGLMCGLLMSGAAWAQTKETKEAEESKTPPVTKIVFYKHGLGYFERVGQVRDSETVTLQFKASQMPDLLPSLFVIDYGKDCKIASIGYDSKDPIDKQLENILIRVPENAALTQFLTQLKGVKVEVVIGSETVRGNVLGIEPVTQKLDNNVLSAWKLILLSEDGAIKPFNLLDMSSLKILDELLQKDLQRILDIYLNAKYTDRKTVKIRTIGKGARNMKIGYLVEMPVWKTSYRLILGDDAKPYLQGWAIVENPTDEDWDNVHVSFVAGNPISFMLDLYTSYYPSRSVIDLRRLIPLAAGLINFDEVLTEECMESDEGYGEGSRRLGRRGGLTGRSEAKTIQAAPPSQSFSKLLAGSINSIATGTPIGDLFAYEGKAPVSIGRRQAAMVPIVTENMESFKTLYYRDDISPKILNAVYLTNSTKLAIEPGPINIFEGATSVGSGLVRQALQPGMRDIIPYAIESSVFVESGRTDTPQKAHKASFANGIMIVKRYDMYVNTYRCVNKSQRDFTFYLDQPKWDGAELIGPSKYEDEISGYYRFKFDLPAGKMTEIQLRQRKEISTSVSIDSLTQRKDGLKVYLNEPYLTESMKAFLSELQGLMDEISEQQRVATEAKQETEKLIRDQERYRKNMEILNPNNPKESEKRAEYLERLTNWESRFDALEQIIKKAGEKEREIRNQVMQKIKSFSEE